MKMISIPNIITNYEFNVVTENFINLKFVATNVSTDLFHSFNGKWIMETRKLNHIDVFFVIIYNVSFSFLY